MLETNPEVRVMEAIAKMKVEISAFPVPNANDEIVDIEKNFNLFEKYCVMINNRNRPKNKPCSL